jgi:AraC-like DNA-binding protein
MSELKDAGTLIRLAYQAMKSLGVDVEAVLACANITVDELYNSQLRTPHWAQSVFWPALQTISGDIHIGLRLGSKIPLLKTVVLEHLFLSAENYREGLQRALNYQRLISDAIAVSLCEEGDSLYLRYNYPDSDINQLIDCTAMVLNQVLRIHSDGVLIAQRIELTHPGQGDLAVYSELFQCPVFFNRQENRLYYSSAAFDTRSLHNHPELLRFHLQCAQAQLADLERQDLISDVQQQIASLLETGSLSSETVAKRLGMDISTMRAKLREAGTSFSQILNDYRNKLANKLLLETDESISEIVYLTGFSEPSTFYRAFKRWEGTTPMEYRQSHQNNSS